MSGRHLGEVAYTCRPVAAEEMMLAVQLILGGGGGALAGEAEAVDFMRFAATKGASLAELWMAVDGGGRVGWAGLPMRAAGRTALIVPTPVDASNAAAAAAGIGSLCDRLAATGVRLVQGLLDPGLTGTIAAFAGQGFAAVAELCYLTRTIRRAPAPPEPPGGFRLLHYRPDLHAAFGQAILASYEQSLDCPALNGVRDIDDVMAGHQAVGPFDPESWTLAVDPAGRPAGVLLLSRVGSEGMELVYLGLAPVARRLGLGDHLLRVAMRRVADLKQRRLSLAVDAANAPALRLYHRHGFEELARKVAMVREARCSQVVSD